MANKLIVVIGSGPGIGSKTAAHFASEGFDVALLSRNGDRLKEDAEQVSLISRNPSAKINTYPVDVSRSSDLVSTLDKVKNDLGLPEVVLFNAARVAGSDFGEIPLERLTEDFQLMVVGLYVSATWAAPLLESVKKQHSDSHPSFLITGGGIFQYPAPPVFALSIQKAAQLNFANSLWQILKPKGVHVAVACVNGVVKDDDPVINAKDIANKYWDLYSQDQDQWEYMIDVGERKPMS